jgi:hypothetical protein
MKGDWEELDAGHEKREAEAKQVRDEELVKYNERDRLPKQIRNKPPKDWSGLKHFVETGFGMKVPGRRVCANHCSPMDYLWHAYVCDFPEYQSRRKLPNGDCIVWANRGGGKTQMAAAATLLEGLFKRGCQTRILAGSLDQSCRTYEYLCQMVQDGFEDFLDGKMLKESCRFKNGATVQVLSQSSRAVRGRHIHKLRCDEVELFDEDVLNAAKFVTRSSEGNTAAMEMISTLHRPYGLMQKLIDESPESGIPVFHWCVWEVIEKCGSDRSCSRCALSEHCRGSARQGQGFLGIDDVITQMKRSSKAGFESEMLCLRPNLENAVFADFDPTVHVTGVGYNPTLPVYRAIDYGFTNPFVCLWLQVDGEGTIRVFDEYSVKGKRTEEHAQAVKAQTPGGEFCVAGTFADPAGESNEGTSGKSEASVLRKAGIEVRSKPSRILEGIESIRAALRSGDGKSRLVIDSKCKVLIKSMRCYHYPKANSKGALSELPEKDGIHDHAIDALRYFFANYQKKPHEVGLKKY